MLFHLLNSFSSPRLTFVTRSPLQKHSYQFKSKLSTQELQFSTQCKESRAEALFPREFQLAIFYSHTAFSPPSPAERRGERQDGTADLGVMAEFPGVSSLRDGMLQRTGLSGRSAPTCISAAHLSAAGDGYVWITCVWLMCHQAQNNSNFNYLLPRSLFTMSTCCPIFFFFLFPGIFFFPLMHETLSMKENNFLFLSLTSLCTLAFFFSFSSSN